MSALDKLKIAYQTQREAVDSESQKQTKDAFSFKWAKRDTYESPAFLEATRFWLFEKYFDNSAESLSQILSGGRKLILDAGCGSGLSASLLFAERLKEHDYLGVDISDAVDVARQRFAELGIPGDFLQLDLESLPVPDNSFDIIFSEGVLHHLDNPGRAISFLASKLKPGGRFLFYVYRKKALVREFTDDAVRERLSRLSDEEAWDALIPLTELGAALGRLEVEVEVPHDIPLLQIPRGKISLQRLFYWYICKMYYRPDYTIQEMNHINFDWFRPLNCYRFTAEQVHAFCAAAGLAAERFREEEAGFSVIASRL